MKATSMLDTRLHLSAPDDFYEALIAAHHGLEPSASHALNARLVLLLANQVGDQRTLLAALNAARGDGRAAQAATPSRADPVVPAHARQ